MSFDFRTRPTLFLIVAVSFICNQARVSNGQERVTVIVESGRAFTGAISPRSDENELWLQLGTSSAYVQRPIRWNTIVQVQRGNESLTADRLRELLGEATTVPPSEGIEEITTPTSREDVAAVTIPRRNRHYRTPSRSRVSSVDFDACLVNWDADVASDGLVVRVFPIDDYGRVVAASGIAYVELRAQKSVDFNEVPRSRGVTTRRVARWTSQVRGENMSPSGIVLKLPFSSLSPETEQSLAHHGLVHIRLVIPGHGVFEHAIDNIRIRPFSPTRMW